MVKGSSQFMVDFTLPQILNNEFINHFQQQKKIVDQLFSEGKLLNYSLSLETSKLWAVFNAESEVDVLEMVSKMPLSPFMKINISALTLYNALSNPIPVFSSN